ncbi:MAG: aminotransferase class IV [Haloferacaceae archaeon]
MQYHVDGTLVAAGETAVGAVGRGFAFGDAVTVPCRIYGGDPFAWEATLDRLETACDHFDLDPGLTDADLRARVAETLRANDLADALVELTVVRGGDEGAAASSPTLTSIPTTDPSVVVAASPLPRGGRDGTPVWDAPATLQTVKTRRISPEAVPESAYTHNRLDAVRARLELRRAAVDGSPADEALMLDGAGRVAEGAASTVFFVAGDALRTPALDGPVTPRVYRDVVLDLAATEGLPVAEVRVAPADVREADEAFLVNPTWELRPVASVDGIDVGGGPVTSLLSRLFDDRVDDDHY